MDTFFKKQYTVVIHEADRNGSLSPLSLCNYLQTTADFHARTMGTSVQQVTEKNITWVYSRLHLIVDRYPFLYETFQVETWRSIARGPCGYREFRIMECDEKEIAVATSSVALIDVEQRKPVNIPRELNWQFAPETGTCY